MGIKIKGFNRVASYSGLLLVAFFGLIIFPISLAVDSTEATVTPSTTTLTLSTSDISAEITPNNANGTFVASDPATVSVTTNNYSGYTLGITANNNTDNTKLINTDDNTAYLTSISSASAPADFNVGNWGYLPSKLNGAANSAYQPAPTTTATTLEATNAANPTANEYTIALGAKADYTLPEGTYENTFTLTAVANPVAYTITYDKNTTDTVTNMPTNLIGDTTATTVTISNLVPQRTNYTFLGWNTVADGSGTTYNPNGGGTDLTYDLNQTTANTDVLYAQWKPDKIYIQDVTIETCPTVATTVYDSRDETEYHIQKLTDGECWMLDNLALDLTNSNIKNTLSTSNTNATATSISRLINGGGSTSDKYAITGVANWASDYSYSAPLVIMTNKDVIPDDAPTNGAGYNKTGGLYNYCAASAGSYCYGNGTSSGTSSGNATEDICPKNWRLPTGNTSGEYAALANIVYGSTGNTNDVTAMTDYRNVLSLPFSTYSTNGSISGQGNGYFWSNTQNGNSYMYAMTVGINSIGTAITNPSYSYGSRYYGISVRCVAKDDDINISFNSNGGTGTMTNQVLPDFGGILNSNTFTRANYNFIGWNTAADGSGVSYADGVIYTGISTTLYAQWESCLSTISGYMQNIGVASGYCNGASGTMTDSRDGTVYHVAKLADGRIWMLDNLAIDLTNSTVKNNLTASTTNASATSLNYLKNGGGSTSDQYATAGVANWLMGSDSVMGLGSFSYTEPFIYMTDKNVVPSNAPAGSIGYNRIGGLYNFCAASAGSYCYNNATGNATEDICPAGWKLPVGGTRITRPTSSNPLGEYAVLANTIFGAASTSDSTNAANYRKILSVPYSGYIAKGFVSQQGTVGYFWSNKYKDKKVMNTLLVDSSNINPEYAMNDRSYGMAVRCIAK